MPLRRKHGKDGGFFVVVDSWLWNLHHYLTEVWDVKFLIHGHITEFCTEKYVNVNILHINV